MKFVIGPRKTDHRFRTGILPLEIAEEYWSSPASRQTLNRLAADPWNYDLDEASVRRAGKLGSLYVDSSGALRIEQPGPGQRRHCRLYRYGPPGISVEDLETGTFDNLTCRLFAFFNHPKAHAWPGHPYDLAAFANDVRKPEYGGIAIMPLVADVISFPSAS